METFKLFIVYFLQFWKDKNDTYYFVLSVAFFLGVALLCYARCIIQGGAIPFTPSRGRAIILHLLYLFE